MIKKMNRLILYIFSFLIFLILVPLVKADAAIPGFFDEYGLFASILVIPVFIIESIVAIILTKIISYNIKPLDIILIILIVNLISTVLGVFFIPNGSFLAISLTGYYNAVENPLYVVLMYILTVMIEALLIYAYLHLVRKKMPNSILYSLYVSSVMNVYSYLFLFLFK
ncbi:MAG: hypothetical protein NTV74_02200 [Euryarchaeota archaeon]|nr:hypothetical protein [Euryarchaeota archaeon]